MRTIAQLGTSSDEPMLSEVECFQITGEIDAAWPDVEPLVEKWIKAGYGEIAAEDIKDFVRSGHMQMFCIHKNFSIKLIAITEFVQYPRMKVLRIVAFAGEKPLLAFKFQPALECWARANGAEFIETFATPETVKLDMRVGMKPLYTLMRMPLSRMN